MSITHKQAASPLTGRGGEAGEALLSLLISRLLQLPPHSSFPLYQWLQFLSSCCLLNPFQSGFPTGSCQVPVKRLIAKSKGQSQLLPCLPTWPPSGMWQGWSSPSPWNTFWQYPAAAFSSSSSFSCCNFGVPWRSLSALTHLWAQSGSALQMLPVDRKYPHLDPQPGSLSWAHVHI